jgi:cytochrome c556
MGKQRGPTDVLVIAPTMTGAVTANSYVTVIGELVKFDPAQLAKQAKDYKLDLSPEQIAKYTGRPALVATAVIDEKFVDLAKKPLPPMTADDLALSKVMKQVGPAFAALRAGIDNNNAEAAAKNVAVLKQAFAETEAFWKTKAKTDATQWAADARKQVDLVDHAVAAAKWDDAKAPAGTLGQSCASCHGAYRERLDDGTYRIKMAAK